MVTLKQLLVSARIRPHSNKHQQYIRLANFILKQRHNGRGANHLRHRSTIIELPEAINVDTEDVNFGQRLYGDVVEQ